MAFMSPGVLAGRGDRCLNKEGQLGVTRLSEGVCPGLGVQWKDLMWEAGETGQERVPLRREALS